MPLTSVLVHLDLTDASASRTRLARDLAALHRARLIGLCASEPSDAIRLMGTPPAGLLAGLEARLSETFERQRGQFEGTARGTVSQWRSQIASPLALLRRSASAADLIVVGQATEEAAQSDFHLDPADAVMSVGRPVLIVPPGIDRLSVSKVVVAWKQGRSAELALQLALPLLGSETQATVLGIGEETSPAELDQVRDYLSRHGVPARTVWEERGELDPATAIARFAVNEGAGLIICGAYGRSQVFEWVLGGVTQSLLSDSPVCCLMVH